MSDSPWRGRRFRTLNVLDDYNRQALRIEIDTSLPAARVVRALNELIEIHGKPKRLRVDNGPEFISKLLADWAANMASIYDSFNPENPRRMLTSKDLIALTVPRCWIVTSLKHLKRCGV